MPEPTTILLIDDHRLVRQGVRAFLATQPDLAVVGEAESGAEGVSLAAQLAPDVVLIDLLMPGMDGVEATRQLKRASPRTQIVVLTSYHSDEHIFPALRAGALSYVLKDIGSEALADAIRRAARGEAVLHPQVATRVIRELQGAQHDAFNPFTELSERELEVLRLIAAGLSNAEIAERLVLVEGTVANHVEAILNRLNFKSRTQVAVWAVERGLYRSDRDD
jgi:NarL family two-component system response regulator LiaR